MAKKAVCQSNLNAIGKALAMYSGISSGSAPFPLIVSVGLPNSTTLGQSNDSTKGPFDTALGTNGMQNFWLITAANAATSSQGLLAPSAFHCPSDGNWLARNSTSQWGWVDMKNFSYGVTWCYDAPSSGGTANPYKLSDDGLDGGIIIMSDLQPGGTAGAKVVQNTQKPSNHTNDGEALLYRAGNVGFYSSTVDSKAGQSGTEIYNGGIEPVNTGTPPVTTSIILSNRSS
jgi:hypothetical protein